MHKRWVNKQIVNNIGLLQNLTLDVEFSKNKSAKKLLGKLKCFL